MDTYPPLKKKFSAEDFFFIPYQTILIYIISSKAYEEIEPDRKM